MLCEAIRRGGMSDTKAALTLGIGRSTLSGWKKEHPELDEWLAMAREQFREAKLAIVDEARTRDGRPDWRAAAWALETAFPEDYGKPARPRRGAEGGRKGWRQAASVLEQAFPEEYGDPALAGRGRDDQSIGQSEELRPGGAASPIAAGLGGDVAAYSRESRRAQGGEGRPAGAAGEDLP